MQKKAQQSQKVSGQGVSESESWSKSLSTSYPSLYTDEWSKESPLVSTETQLKNLNHELEKTLNIKTLKVKSLL